LEYASLNNGKSSYLNDITNDKLADLDLLGMTAGPEIQHNMVNQLFFKQSFDEFILDNFCSGLLSFTKKHSLGIKSASFCFATNTYFD
jgi:hypothetical protein